MNRPVKHRLFQPIQNVEGKVLQWECLHGHFIITFLSSNSGEIHIVVFDNSFNKLEEFAALAKARLYVKSIPRLLRNS